MRSDNSKLKTEIEKLSSFSQCRTIAGDSRSVLGFWPSLVAVDSESCQRLFPSFCALPSEKAVLFDWNLSRRRICCFAQDLIRNMWICFYALFFSETNKWLKDWAKQAQLWSITSSGETYQKISFRIPYWKKKSERKSVVTAHNLQGIKTFWTLKLSQYRKSGSTFSSSKPVGASSDWHRFRNALCWCSPFSPAQPVPAWSAASKAWPLMLQSKPSIFFWNSLWEWLPDDLQWLELGLEFELCRLTNEL